eukprot:TRINITY_DN13968_c0_g1_i1.p1 TRINITY_DN13968_c0_g1~~TRINITY_DN13968_c0_g1_i1.p1  ORF type:complete len:226 (+),score=53.17 TRINITY_DN13968_c0_g1_i1:480-1157(+)
MDYLDLYQIHWPSADVPLSETLRAMKELKKSGKIKHFGVSNFGPTNLGDALKEKDLPVVSNQVIYNLITRAVEFEVLPKAVENDIAVIAYSTLAQGILSGKFASPDDVPEGRQRTYHFNTERKLARHGGKGFEKETWEALAQIEKIAKASSTSMIDLSLAWVLAQKGIATVLVGARTPEQLTSNIKSAKTKLSEKTIQELSAATKPLQDLLGSNIDAWNDKSRAK